MLLLNHKRRSVSFLQDVISVAQHREQGESASLTLPKSPINFKMVHIILYLYKLNRNVKTNIEH